MGLFLTVLLFLFIIVGGVTYWSERRREIRQSGKRPLMTRHHSSRDERVRFVAYAFFACTLALAAFGHFVSNKGAWSFSAFAEDFYTNYFAEIMGIMATVFLIDRLTAVRDRRLERQRELDALIGHLGSADRGQISAALARLRQMDALSDGSLQSAILVGADLSEQNLSNADLDEVYLPGAKFVSSVMIGVHLDRADLSKTDLSRAKLQKCHMKDAQLNDAILSDADLAGADLQGASLHRANLHHAILEHADFSNARLISAELPSANLDSAVLRSADLSFADLSRACLNGADLSGAVVDATKFKMAVYDSTTLWPANFDYRTVGAIGPGANLENETFKGVSWVGFDLQKVRLAGADLRESVLSGANLRSADLRTINLNRASLVNTNLEGADLRKADLREASLVGARLEGADLGGANIGGEGTMSRTVFKGAFCDENTRWPDGIDYRSAGVILKARQ